MKKLLIAVVIGSVAQFVISFVVFFVVTFAFMTMGVPPFADVIGMVLNQLIIAVAIVIAVLYSHDWKPPGAGSK